eukprot:CAMPEP_0202729782 /NCGR_PEP_ID=MMETSP1385-20130828/186306_1 /ASSEMBLY_ACC=CAM_ASM_000861 /TAXON_ID=933848 /ORGANISM="Elphidium margaritaceum" /LENGTH=626 /DNA_ID=CAMNT_0049396053 /DNA_START=32 /DNA_END=1913 /DNA_ORIENTATION=+
MSQDKIQKARELVLNYIATHSLSDKLNRAVNEVCKSRPKDPWLFLSDTIREWTKDVPLIDRLACKQGIDSVGGRSLQLQLYGRVANARPPRSLGMDNILLRVVANAASDDSKSDNHNSSNNDDQTAMQRVSEVLSPVLRGIRIDQQKRIDEELRSKLDNSDAAKSRFNLSMSVSALIAMTAADYLQTGAYRYLSRMRRTIKDEQDEFEPDDDDDDEDITQYRLPNLMCALCASANNTLPVVSLVSTDRLSPMQRITAMTEIAAALMQQQHAQSPPTICAQTGAILIADDDDKCGTTQQLLSMVENAIAQCAPSIGVDDIGVCVSYSRQPSAVRYDAQTASYEIEGNKYSTQTIAQYFEQLCAQYTAIRFVQDPLSSSSSSVSLDNEQQLQAYATVTTTLRAKNVNVIGAAMYASDMASNCDPFRAGSIASSSSVPLDNEQQLQANATVTTTLRAKNVNVIGAAMYASDMASMERGIKRNASASAVVSTTQMKTVSHALNMANLVETLSPDTEYGFGLIVSDAALNDNSSNSTYAVDLSVACNADILCLPLPNCAFATKKYNRWLVIADEIGVRVTNGQEADNRSGTEAKETQPSDVVVNGASNEQTAVARDEEHADDTDKADVALP